MLTQDRILQLKRICDFISHDDVVSARKTLLAMNIIDTPEHLQQPQEVRNLMWNVYEFLIAEDHQNITDKSTLLKSLSALFDEIN